VKPRILIVDDEEAVRSSLRMIFDYEGYEVSLAANGPAGLKMAEQEAPDLVILATELAGVGGPALPIEVSGVASTAVLSSGSDLRLSITGRVEVSLVEVMTGQETLCDVLDRCREVSEFLVAGADEWKVVFPDELP